MRYHLSLLTVPLILISAITLADDVSDTRHLLCSTLHSDVCIQNEGCVKVPPADLNIPQFILIDARTGELSTTDSSGENRKTTADSVSRGDGQLILQGVELGRAFSLFVDEASGDATFAAAADMLSMSVFAACTPANIK
ncbi:MAG TPA: hypothetical protein VJ984_14685 [Xanthomonadales bacterium]|nr:hypothetical protein [Xanthomonadales bacterium]